MTYIMVDGRKTTQEPADLADLARVELTAAEWSDYQAVIQQLRQPWIRNANKDREIRPARSSSGYKLLSVRDITKRECGKEQARLRIEVETPYRTDSFSFAVAKTLIKKDALQICAELGYKRIYFVGEKESLYGGSVMYSVQLIGDSNRDYYRLQTLATDPPAKMPNDVE